MHTINVVWELIDLRSTQIFNEHLDLRFGSATAIGSGAASASGLATGSATGSLYPNAYPQNEKKRFKFNQIDNLKFY